MYMYMKRFRKDIVKYWRYTMYSAKSNLKSEIANSYLNWLWWVLNPLAFMLIYTFMFSVVFPSKVEYFPVFIFMGITVWDFFSKTMVQSVRLVKANKPIVSKVYLPKYTLLITRMMVNGFKMSISLLIIIGMLIFFKVPVKTTAIYTIPLMIDLFLVTFGIGCYLLHFGVYVEDLTNAINIIIKMLFYMTGIFYDPASRIPAPYGAIIATANPIAYVLSAWRECLLYGHVPSRKIILAWFLFGLLLSMLGVRKIYKSENSYVKVI